MRARTITAVVLVVLGVYVVLVLWRSLLLLRDGSGPAVALGLAILVISALVIGLVAREVRLGLAMQRMGGELGAEGGLPRDDLPRRPSGRVERDAADAAYAEERAAVETAPDDWRGWFRLALAYDAAGDRRRARAAMRHAAQLHRRG
jgi:hypothetical protein